MPDNLPALPERRFELAQIHDMAEAIARSGLFGIKTAEQAFALMLIADAEGSHPATVAQDYDIIQGRPARKSHSVLARFQAAGGTIEWHELNSTIADATFKHPKGGAARIEWTMEMAANAKLAGKDNWRAYPRAMLRARCISEGVRTVFPAALGGALMVEEAQDLEPFTIDNDPPAAPPPRVGRQPKAEAPPPADVTDVEVKQQPTEQQTIDEQTIDDQAPPPSAPTPPAAKASNGTFVGEGEKTFLRNKAKSLGMPIEQILADCGGLVIDKLTKEDFDSVKAHIRTLEEAPF